jgi:signal peptidase I
MTESGARTSAAAAKSPITEPIASDPGAEYPRIMAQDDSLRSSPETGWLGAIQSLVVTVVIAVFIITFLLQAFQIPSPSMENTLLIGDYLLVDKLHFADGGAWGRIVPYSRLKRGDIVVFRYPVNPKLHFVKRVIGLPGDRVRLIEKRVLVNGIPLDERGYAVHRRARFDQFRDNFPDTGLIPRGVEAAWWLEMKRQVRGGELVVPEGKYFVMGDNRDDSLDSRYWGFVPKGNILGRPLIIYWSFTTPWRGPAAGNAPDGKLKHFAYALTHPWQFTRWDRTLRLVK